MIPVWALWYQYDLKLSMVYTPSDRSPLGEVKSPKSHLLGEPPWRLPHVYSMHHSWSDLSRHIVCTCCQYWAVTTQWITVSIFQTPGNMCHAQKGPSTVEHLPLTTITPNTFNNSWVWECPPPLDLPLPTVWCNMTAPNLFSFEIATLLHLRISCLKWRHIHAQMTTIFISIDTDWFVTHLY